MDRIERVCYASYEEGMQSMTCIRSIVTVCHGWVLSLTVPSRDLRRPSKPATKYTDDTCASVAACVSSAVNDVRSASSWVWTSAMSAADDVVVSAAVFSCISCDEIRIDMV